MEGDEITIVLSRASELRSKITNCIDKASKRDKIEGENGETPSHSIGEDNSEAEEEAESLLSIRDALESLEEQLSSLQVLQQQQRYEREATLAEIDHSRKILLRKIEEYKGEDLEVIHEASSFASETVEHNDDLLLPPYPSRAPGPLILDNAYPSKFPYARSFSRNGVSNIDPHYNARKSTSDAKNEQTQNPPQKSQSGLRVVFNMAAKTMLTLVSVVSILSLAGFETKLGRGSTHFNLVNFLKKPRAEGRATIQCPPGKVLVMENGEPRCLVKERVEIPFEPVVTTPNVSYGCG